VRGEGGGPDVIALLGDGSPLVVAGVARALRHPSLRAHHYDGWRALLSHQDEKVVAAALSTALCKDLGAGRARAIDLCREGRFAYAGAALILALFGEERDVDLFRAWLTPDCGSALVRAVGYFGAADLVPSLVNLLGSPHEGTRRAAAEALVCITGGALTETAEVPLYDDDEKPFVDDPDATTEVIRASTDRAAWLTWWSDHRGSFAAGHRYRGGQLHGAPAVFQVLDGPALLEERTLADCELRAMAGSNAPHLPITDWTARQNAPMARWADWVRSAPAETRGWRRARA
jgi:HEAT repeat protein